MTAKSEKLSSALILRAKLPNTIAFFCEICGKETEDPRSTVCVPCSCIFDLSTEKTAVTESFICDDKVDKRDILESSCNEQSSFSQLNHRKKPRMTSKRADGSAYEHVDKLVEIVTASMVHLAKQYEELQDLRSRVEKLESLAKKFVEEYPSKRSTSKKAHNSSPPRGTGIAPRISKTKARRSEKEDHFVVNTTDLNATTEDAGSADRLNL